MIAFAGIGNFLKKKTDDPKKKITVNDRITALKETFFSKIGFVWIFFQGFFGPEFFQSIADFLFNMNLPKHSLVSVLIAVGVWGLGSAFIYFSKLRQRKLDKENDNDSNHSNNADDSNQSSV